MTAVAAHPTFFEERTVARDEVHYRARAFGPDARPLSLLIVNMSAMGMMARCEAPLTVGERLNVRLPIIGVIVAEIRWALGGRMGLQLDRPIDLADYYELLAVLMTAR